MFDILKSFVVMWGILVLAAWRGKRKGREMSELNLELVSTENLIEEIGKRCDAFVFSAVLKECRKKGEIVTCIESSGDYYTRLGMCTDLQFLIYDASKEEI